MSSRDGVSDGRHDLWMAFAFVAALAAASVAASCAIGRLELARADALGSEARAARSAWEQAKNPAARLLAPVLGMGSRRARERAETCCEVMTLSILACGLSAVGAFHLRPRAASNAHSPAAPESQDAERTERASEEAVARTPGLGVACGPASRRCSLAGYTMRQA